MEGLFIIDYDMMTFIAIAISKKIADLDRSFVIADRDRDRDQFTYCW